MIQYFSQFWDGFTNTFKSAGDVIGFFNSLPALFIDLFSCIPEPIRSIFLVFLGIALFVVFTKFSVSLAKAVLPNVG